MRTIEEVKTEIERECTSLRKQRDVIQKNIKDTMNAGGGHVIHCFQEAGLDIINRWMVLQDVLLYIEEVKDKIGGKRGRK